MKRTTLTVAFAAACSFSLVPAVAQSASADSPATRQASFQSASAHSSLVGSAQSQSAALVKAVGLSADNAFKIKDVLKDTDGSTHVRVDRTFKGIPVVGGDLVIHRDASGKVTGHDGMFDGAITVDTAPAIPKATGEAKGLAAAKAHKKSEGLDAAKGAGSTLVIRVDEAGKQQLAYMVKTTGMQKDRTPSRVRSFINADTGAVISSFDEIAHATGNGIYDKNVTLTTSGSSGSYKLSNPNTGNYTTDSNNQKINGTTMTDADNVWGDGSNSNRQSAGVDAQYGADTTFDYYKSVMGRNGIWNNGNGARSRVHYDNNYVNAFWDGTQMTYGDGDRNANPLTELDVAGHEMSHGVTENTAGLDYSGDAGGLNEATSDIFGTGVEWYANLASDKPDFLLGEEIDINGDGTPLRYMDKPSKDGASYDCYSSSVGSADPHYSSGPLNHWYFLASNGSGAKTINGVSYNSSTCDSSSVTGAGRADIEKVWYRTLSTKLTSTSNYQAAREGAIKSAVELYGGSSQVCKSVESAFNAINVPKGTAACSTSTTPTPTPTPTLTPGTNAVTNGDFEAGQTGWTGTDGPITNNAGEAAHGGSWKMWLGGNGSTSTEYEQQSVKVPASGKLTYYVHVDTAETTRSTKYDTAKVQVINGTTTSTVSTFSNLDAASGYVAKTVDLSAFAGKTVTLKFTASEDSVSQTSFVFDDVVVK